MTIATMEDVQARLPELLDTLDPRDELVITRDGRPVARLASTQTGVPVPGRGKGKLVIHSDEDLPPEAFLGPI